MCTMVPQQQRRRRRRAALPRAGERRVVVARGAGGFGFTIAGQRPCVVSAVAAGGPAERAGLRAGDALIAVDGASVARAPHASVARLVAAAPGAIALSVAPRDAPPTDTEDTEPDERARTRRRHPPPRHHRRPQLPLTQHPGCQAVPSTSAVSEILQRLTRAQLSPSHAARLECRAVVGYLGTIETPQAESTGAPGNVRMAVRKLRQERRTAAPVLLSVLPGSLVLRRPAGQPMATYSRERIVYAGCPSDANRRYFGLVTAAESPDAMDTAHCTHVFAVDPRAADHEAHAARARDFHIPCTRDPVAERCLEFPPSAEYVVGVIRGMYSLPPDDGSPALLPISKLALKSDSPAAGNFARNRNALLARDRPRNEDAAGFIANSPQPSNHSEITTTSSNSDSGIGFHNDGRNITDRIVLVDFAGQPPTLNMNRFRQEMPRRPLGLVGCSSFDADGSFLSNTTPVVDGFAGQGRPLNLDDVLVNSLDLPARRVSPRGDCDVYNYNNIYGNAPSTSRDGAVYDQVYTENEGHYELLPDGESTTYNSVEIYEERGCSAESVGDSVSVYSSRSVEEPRVAHRRHLQTSLDDMLVLGRREPTPNNDDTIFLHPAAVKCKVRKSKNLLSRTREMFTGKGRDKERRRAMSASAGDVTAGGKGDDESLPAAASEPDLRDAQSEQSSPFRRWTTGGGAGAGSSYRHADHRVLYNKMSEGTDEGGSSSGSQWPNGGVARWSLGIDHLLNDPAGGAAFAAFLRGEYAHENLAFYNSCELYTKTTGDEARESLAREIWQRHLADGAPEPVNIDAAARRSALAKMEEFPPPPDMFASDDKSGASHDSQQANPSNQQDECLQLLVRRSRRSSSPKAPDNTPTEIPDSEWISTSKSIVIMIPPQGNSCSECQSYHYNQHQPRSPRQHRAKSVPPDASYYDDLVRRGYMDPRYLSTRTSSQYVEPSSYAGSSERASTPNSERMRFQYAPYLGRMSLHSYTPDYFYGDRPETPSDAAQQVPQHPLSPCNDSEGIRRQSLDSYQAGQYWASTPLGSRSNIAAMGWQVRPDKSGLLPSDEPDSETRAATHKPPPARVDVGLAKLSTFPVHSKSLNIPSVTVTDHSSTSQEKKSSQPKSVYDHLQPFTSRQVTAQPSTSRQPTAQPSTSRQPTAQPTTSRQPRAQPSTSRQPTAQPSTSRQPTAQQTTSRQHTAQPSTSRQPTAQLSTSRQPTAQLSTSRQATAQPSTSQQATAQSSTLQEVSSQQNSTQPATSSLPSTSQPKSKVEVHWPPYAYNEEEAQRQIYNMMRLDLYPRFLRSGVHAECARADLRGLPSPYSSPASSEQLPSKLKKSASNASERRRSGGGSLLPWRLRVPSKNASDPFEHAGRHSASDAAPGATALGNGPPNGTLLLSDVVKSGALCRVVLPDGATSVVGVDGSVPVRRLIDRLLARRNLHANGSHYDVILKDAPQGENPVIDGGAPSSVLGGREVFVERRCVVRLEVGGRCVAVRCRPQRRLRHVLRPVIARYAPAGSGLSYKATVLKDGVPLHPDTPMQEIDGARLTMVEISEPSAEPALDEDTESLSEIAVRLDVPADAPDDGRVRAALRPGPPLHHHPPDFLDNLRETQRARLASGAKNEPTPAPRAPPPLPPKPQRQPTLV